MATAISEVEHRNVQNEAEWLLRTSRAPRLRSMCEFVESEIVIPKGPFEGRRFRMDRQPYCRLWFAELDSGRWTEFTVTGPTQSGKTLVGYVIPLMYHLFEMRETVICGVPQMDMAQDKWFEDILPVVERTAYRDLLPVTGGGSRGGMVDTLRFRHGPVLKFMSGGGDDKSRAAYTARVLVVTETDGMDEPASRSRETDKISQLEARTMAYGERARIYKECTVSTEDGRTWQDYGKGTASRIVRPCPHCGSWVSPERQHLTGWQDAETELEASERSTFCCPECGAPWTDAERFAANRESKLLHRGQVIDRRGRISGPLPKTRMLGFRWSAVDNHFWSAAVLGAAEWRAARAANEEDAEKRQLQFVWCRPWTPPKTATTPLDANAITRRTEKIGRGRVPPDCEYLTAGVDLGKYLSHWVLVAFGDMATPHVVDYGVLEVPSDAMAVERALLQVLRGFADTVRQGWRRGDRPMTPSHVWIDSGWMADVVYEFCREAGDPFMPCKGHGTTQDRFKTYARPRRRGRTVRFVGEEYHGTKLQSARVTLWEVNADYWKAWAHERLITTRGEPGAMTLFEVPTPRDHRTFAKHLCAEQQVEEFKPGKGLVRRWEQVRPNNHYLDALYAACAAGHLAGARLVESAEPVTVRKSRKRRQAMTMPDGRPFLITER